MHVSTSKLATIFLLLITFLIAAKTNIRAAASPNTVTVTSPANNATISGTVTVSATVAGSAAIAGIQYTLDGVNLQGEVVNWPFSVTWNTLIVTNGTHTLSATLRDGNGNTATSPSITVSVNNPYSISSTFYVDGNLTSDCLNGNYSITNRNCTGSDGTAFKKVNDAFAYLIAGKTLLIRSGTYREISNAQSSSYFLDVSGTSTMPITIKGYPGEAKPVLTYDPNHIPRWVSSPDELGYYLQGPIIQLGQNANNIIIDGLEIVGYRNTGIEFHQSAETCIGGDGGVNANQKVITVQNSSIHDCVHAGIKGRWSYHIYNNEIYNIDAGPNDKLDYVAGHGPYGTNGGHAHGMYLQGSHGEIIGNYIHDIGGILPTGTPINIFDVGFGCYQASTQGPCPTSPGFWKIGYNLIINNKTDGIALYGHDVDIYNNTITGVTDPSGSGLSIGKNDSYNVTVRNNIIWGNTNDIFLDDPISVTHDHNIIGVIKYQSHIDNYWHGTSETGGFYGVNPQFVSVNPKTLADVRLQSSSPAINAGTNLGSPYQNAFNPSGNSWPLATLDQNSQGSAWEIGAYAYTGSGNAVIPTSAPPACAYYNLPYDTNNDGKLNGLDYITTLMHYNQSQTGPASGDTNCSGKVDIIDLNNLVSAMYWDFNI